MTEVRQMQRHKFLYKIMTVGVIALIQALSFLLLMNLYLFFSPFPDLPYLNTELNLYFYSFFALPIALLVGNSFAMFSSKRGYIVLFTILSLGAFLFYWSEDILIHPYKVCYVIAISIGIYLLGILITSRIRDWIS